jgi:anti-sigma regulatory factor (Ser/Thr protein kinase)
MAAVRRLRLGGPGAPAAARRFVSAAVEEAEVDERLREPLRLVASEVVTNSVRHGCSRHDDCVEVKIEVEPERVRLEVADEGHGFEPVPTRGRPERPGGWGLYLVDSLADNWGVEDSATTRVWLELSARSSAA